MVRNSATTSEIIGLADGYRESTQSWRELLLDLQRRGLTHAPDLAIGDGALGFWNALREVFGATKEQRCWFHKTGNVLNAMPKSVQAKAKGHLHDIWQAETRVDAEAAFNFFVATYGVKYDKAVTKLTKDRDGSCLECGGNSLAAISEHWDLDLIRRRGQG
jgi:putative transposase